MPDVVGHKHKVQLFIYLFILQIPPLNKWFHLKKRILYLLMCYVSLLLKLIESWTFTCNKDK